MKKVSSSLAPSASVAHSGACWPSLAFSKSGPPPALPVPCCRCCCSGCCGCFWGGAACSAPCGRIVPTGAPTAPPPTAVAAAEAAVAAVTAVAYAGRDARAARPLRQVKDVVASVVVEGREGTCKQQGACRLARQAVYACDGICIHACTHARPACCSYQCGCPLRPSRRCPRAASAAQGLQTVSMGCVLYAQGLQTVSMGCVLYAQGLQTVSMGCVLCSRAADSIHGLCVICSRAADSIHGLCVICSRAADSIHGLCVICSRAADSIHGLCVMLKGCREGTKASSASQRRRR